MLESFLIICQKQVLFLTFISILITAVLFFLKAVNNSYIRKILILCSIWWIILVFKFPPHGFNYEIYRYNASLSYNGQQSFGRNLTESDYKEKKTPGNPSFLDYTGAQHLLYVVLYSVTIKNTKFWRLGFQLWSIVLFITTLFLLFYYSKFHGNENSKYSIAWIAILFAFHPVFSLHFLIISWEDKLLFFIIPLLLILLNEKEHFLKAAFLIGFTTGFNGACMFFIPAFFIQIFREKPNQLVKCILLSVLGLILSLIPFFPESYSGWLNRVERMNLAKPDWYSIYLLLPGGIYSPLVSKIIIISVTCTAHILFYQKRINAREMIIASVFILIALGPFNNIGRMLPLIMLIIVITPGKSKNYYLTIYFLFFIYFFLSAKAAYLHIDMIQVIFFYIPVFWVISFYIYRRIQYSANGIDNTVPCQMVSEERTV